MTSPLSSSKASAISDREAFLTRVECRAYAMLWLQSGDPVAAEKSLMAVIRVFCAHARELPPADWPLRFWRLLLLTPAAEAQGHWPPALGWLADLPPEPRRALLLRLVAGLLETDAALALEIEPTAYEQLLTEVCPLDAQGRPDIEAWRQRAGSVYQQVRALEQSSPETERLRRIRATVLSRIVKRERMAEETDASGEAPPRSTPAWSEPARSRSRGRWRWAALVLVLAGAGGATAWFFQDGSPAPGSEASASQAAAVAHNVLSAVADAAIIRQEDLAPERGIAVRTDAPSLPRSLPEVEAPADQLAFFLWYAAGAPETRFERGVPDTANESRAINADPAGSEAIAVAMPDESSLVDYQQAWAELSDAQRTQVRQTAEAFARLDQAMQAQLHLRYWQLDGIEQRGWLLGPKLGPRYYSLQPLIGLVAESERMPLLTLLRGFDERQLEQVAVLAQRVQPQDRDALRRELLRVPADKRDGWLSRRVRQ